MSNPPHGGPPPGEPGRPPQQPWPQQWPQQPGAQQPGPWGPPAPGPYGGQPPYGQQPPPGPQCEQPWGAQPPAAPRRSRRGLVTGIVVPAVLLLVAVVLARLFADTVLDTGAVEDDVAAQFQQLEGVAIDLTCDDEMQVEQGAEYECTGTTADGEDVALRIVITDETDASYTWEEV